MTSGVKIKGVEDVALFMSTAAVSLPPRATPHQGQSHRKDGSEPAPTPQPHETKRDAHPRTAVRPLPAAPPFPSPTRARLAAEGRRARSLHSARIPPMPPSALLVRPPAPASPSLTPRRCAPVSAAAATLRTSPVASSVAQFSRFLSPRLCLAPPLA